MGSLSTANVEFCLDVFKELNSNNIGDNIFFSPLSLLYALSMILLGARRNSAEQMEKVLHFNHVVESLKPGFKDSSKCSQAGRIHSELGALLSQIKQPDSNYTLSIANRLYGTKLMAFHQQYLTCSEKLYQAQLKTVDFEHSPEETRKTINAWVESKTNGKVTNLFGKGTIDPSSVMVLVNVIYFKGQWQNKFQEGETSKTPFQLGEGKSVTVDMMYQTGIFKLAFIKKPRIQVLELPFVNNRLSMIILLPVGKAKLEQIEKELNLKTFQEWTSSSNMMEKEVEVYIPRFKLEIKYELNSLLKSLGMTDIFDQTKADLSRMSPAKNLYLSKVIHKSYVDVNEEGTEAAAATGNIVVVKNVPMRAQFMANRPFLFFIKHTRTNMILFFGKLASP
ncbi:serpin B11 [Trichechus manatus latirostris]|uniref:Serpin B7 n=1 Tax=Trichechus manatus latirostris TaxID=127582 RepID=A0A2Y9RE07_TRIMA|nr:serpin B11 [Trichechus manatus latirostris]XP_023589782.1 serpin B11 [Trichechus manatus latirostris]XP_023589783.1 serpin B11 [Trichechus manatus latirostris]